MRFRIRFVMALILILGTVPLQALPWGKSWARGRELPRPVGIGIDVFAMDQEYDVVELQFTAPGVSVPSVTGLDVENAVSEINLKVDAWLLPFLNVFALVGELEGKTVVDLEGSNISALLPFDTFRFDYDGTVYGGGVTLAGGGERYFGSLTASYTETDLGGDFDSAVEAFVLMPKIGLQGDKGAFWIGAFILDTSETHSGKIPVPFLGQVDFDLELKERDSTNFLVGGSVTWDHLTLTLEGGFSKRSTLLMSFGYRF